MRVDAFDFDLPEDRIALRPARPRDAARMLVVRPAVGLADLHVRDLPDLMRPGDAIVVNDTRVIAGALSGERIRGDARVPVSVNLMKRLAPDRWIALARPARRLKPGDRLRFAEQPGNVCLLGSLEGVVAEKGEAGEVTIAFDFSGPVLDEAIAAFGAPPLPPYIAGRRMADEADRQDYQTVFADREGAVAAPTAGLHLTPELIDRLVAGGVALHRVTLHVGAGTFLPVKADDTADHVMHSEWGEVSAGTAAALNAIRMSGGRILAVGTTSARLLESAADAAGRFNAFSGETAIFITPGYRFRGIDLMLTNFHLPRSTLFMLVSAFSGLETMRAAYAHAIAAGYRFYSYGDACLLFPERT